MYLERGHILMHNTDLTKAGVGRIVIRRVRLLRLFKAAWFYTTVDGSSWRYDVPRHLLRPLMRCESRGEALKVLGV